MAGDKNARVISSQNHRFGLMIKLPTEDAAVHCSKRRYAFTYTSN